MPEGEVAPKDKIQILLAEYNTLRSQIISRGTSMFQTVTIGIASLGLVASQASASPWLSTFLFVFLLLVIALLGRLINRDLHEEAEHVRKLENKINALVREPLLTWENRFGRAKTGWWHGLFPRTKRTSS